MVLQIIEKISSFFFTYIFYFRFLWLAVFQPMLWTFGRHVKGVRCVATPGTLHETPTACPREAVGAPVATSSLVCALTVPTCTAAEPTISCSLCPNISDCRASPRCHTRRCTPATTGHCRSTLQSTRNSLK